MNLLDIGRHDRPGVTPNSLRPLFSPLTALALAIGVIVPLIFLASYVGALHNPKPKDMPFGVTAPSTLASSFAQQINAASNGELKARVESSAAVLRADLEQQQIYGGLAVTPPSTIPIGVVASPIVAPILRQEIAAGSHNLFQAHSEPSLAALKADIATQKVYGGLVLSSQTSVQVFTYSGADLTVSRILGTFAQQFAKSQHIAATVTDLPLAGSPSPRSLTTIQVLIAGAANYTASSELISFGQKLGAAIHANVAAPIDVKPLRTEDSTGLTSLYLVIAWVFGGYFLATVATTIVGFKQWSRKHSLARLGSLAVCSLASGLIGTMIASAFGAVASEHFWAITGAGTLIVFATAAATAGVQALIGMYGTQVALIAFILLGNPSSGGIAAPPMLPEFWRAIGPWLPNAAGFTLIRNTLYYGGHNFGSAIPVLALYAVAGAALLLIFGSSRIALYTPKVDLAVDALRPARRTPPVIQ